MTTFGFLSVLFGQVPENCLLPKDPSADSNDFLKTNFDIFGYRVNFLSFLPNYSQRGRQNRFLRVHSTNLDKKITERFVFFSKLSGKTSAYGCQILAPVLINAGDPFEDKHTFREMCISSKFLGIEQKTFCPCFSFYSELSNLHSTCQAKCFQKFFSNRITFFIFFGHWAESWWFSVRLFPVGLSELLSSCP